MFSTLNGQILEWILLVDEEATHQQDEPDGILKFILFEDSTYSTLPAIRKLEAEVGMATFGGVGGRKSEERSMILSFVSALSGSSGRYGAGGWSQHRVSQSSSQSGGQSVEGERERERERERENR